MALAAPVSSGPRIRVAALMLLDGDVVLVRHRRGDESYHLLPGGGVDYRETLAAALQREVKEETGLRILVGRPILINDTIDPDGPRHVVNVTFIATIIGGSITLDPDDSRVEAVELVTPERLSSLDMRPPISAELRAALDASGEYQARYLGSVFVASDDSNIT